MLVRSGGGATLALDLGLPLDSRWSRRAVWPPALVDATDSLVGLVVSHGHPDHYGLASTIPSRIPIMLGRAAERVLQEAAFFGASSWESRASSYLEDRSPFEVGPFRITPYLVDHSAFDAYAILVEVEGRRLFYSGDLRAHGRKRGSFQSLLRRPPRGVDALLLEGTRLAREGDTPAACSEEEVELRFREVIRSAPGMVLATYSPQNVDRLVTAYKAARREGRELVLDLYGACVAAATGTGSISRAGWDGVRVFVPRIQRSKVIEARAFARIDAVAGCRVYPRELEAEPDLYLCSFRESMLGELPTGALAGAVAIWSMWFGYLRRESGVRLQARLDRLGVPLVRAHCSGHAAPEDLRRLAGAIRARRVVPIHTAVPNLYPSHFDRVETHTDGEWWEL